MTVHKKRFSVLTRASEQKLLKKVTNAELREMAVLQDSIIAGMKSCYQYHELELRLAEKYGFRVRE